MNVRICCDTDERSSSRDARRLLGGGSSRRGALRFRGGMSVQCAAAAEHKHGRGAFSVFHCLLAALGVVSHGGVLVPGAMCVSPAARRVSTGMARRNSAPTMASMPSGTASSTVT